MVYARDYGLRVLSTEWTTLDDAVALASFTYSFGPGLANALTVSLGDGEGLAVVSPPCGANAEAAMADVARLGDVKALVASNGFHHLGLPAWRARFPAARVYAPASAIPRLRGKGHAPLLPLSELAAQCGAHVQFVDMPHFRIGEVLVKVHAPSGRYWYLTDTMTNMAQLPTHWLMSRIFRVTKSAPGFRFNHFVGMVMMKDRNAVKRYLREQAEAMPPDCLLFAHGAPVREHAQAQLLAALQR